MQRTSACEMPPLAALPEQLQPLPALRRCRRLFYLDVRSTACSGEAASLSGLPLRLLNVGYSRVRGTQVEAEAALPRCATLLGFRTT